MIFEIWNVHGLLGKLQEVIEEVNSIEGRFSASLKSKRKIIVLQC